MLGAASWRSRASCAALALGAFLVAGSAAQAQNFVRPPNLNIGPRVPTINPNVARVAPNIARVPTPTPMIAPRIVNPNLPTRWLDDFFVNEFEGTFWLFDSNGFHDFISKCSSIGCDQDYAGSRLMSATADGREGIEKMLL